MSEKILGYLFLSIGILVMSFSLVYIWLVFTNKIQPVAIIQAKSIQLDLTQALGNLSTGQAINSSNGGMEIFSGQDMSKTLNLSITFFFMTFVMLFGFRVASLGIMLLRPIVVKVKEKTETPVEALKASAQNTTGTSS